MSKTAQFFLIALIIAWGTLIGAIVYSHVAFFPGYLSHLPESTSLLNETYGIREEKFWMFIHPVTIVLMLIALIMNWRNKNIRKYILIPAVIYALVIISTFIYFVPNLMAFAKSSSSDIPAATWIERGKQWEYLSWIRGLFMLFAFIMLLIGLSNSRRSQ